VNSTLFEEIVLKLDQQTLQSLKQGGLECIVKLFIIVNDKNDMIMNLETKSSQSTTNYQDQYYWNESYMDPQYQAKQKVKFFKKFRVCVPPS